jgi:hypothetical protein
LAFSRAALLDAAMLFRLVLVRCGLRRSEISGGTMSSMTLGMPQLARCAAMRAAHNTGTQDGDALDFLHEISHSFAWHRMTGGAGAWQVADRTGGKPTYRPV